MGRNNMVASNQGLKLMLELMLRIRRFEEEVSKLVRRGLVRGGVHSYVGEEAIAAGVCMALGQNDYIVGTHRGHGHCIAKGANLSKMMAELYGKKNGYCGGKGGSMHIADLALGILGCNGIVPAGLPIGVGAALGSKIRQSEEVTVCFFGDGGVNEGLFHESLNLAAIWKLPVIFVCENNLYAITTRISDTLPIKNIADRASSYSMPGVIVDGNDVLAVYDSTRQAVEIARSGKGPTLIECKTYRWYGHSIRVSITSYRPKEEEKEWLKKCPIKRFKEKLLGENVLTEKEIEEIETRIESEIQDAVKFAQESPEPETEDLLTGLYS